MSYMLLLHAAFDCQVPGQLKEGVATEDETPEVEAFVAELAEVDLVGHKLLLHYQDAQHRHPDHLVPAVPRPVAPKRTGAINLYQNNAWPIRMHACHS
jgi:hypothetical protein